MLWERGLPRLHERLEELAAVIALRRSGSFDAREQEHAAATAHKLAGSLGMFGYPAGTDAARELEHELEAGEEADLAILEEQYAALRKALPL